MSQFLRPRSQRHPIEHFPLGEHDSYPRGADIVRLIRTVALPEGRRRLLPPTGLLDVLPVVLAYGGAVPGRSAPRRRAAQASLVSWRDLLVDGVPHRDSTSPGPGTRLGPFVVLNHLCLRG